VAALPFPANFTLAAALHPCPVAANTVVPHHRSRELVITVPLPDDKGRRGDARPKVRRFRSHWLELGQRLREFRAHSGIIQPEIAAAAARDGRRRRGGHPGRVAGSPSEQALRQRYCEWDGEWAHGVAARQGFGESHQVDLRRVEDAAFGLRWLELTHGRRFDLCRSLVS